MDVLAERWTGGYPVGRAPAIEPIESSLALRRVAAGSTHDATVWASDPDGDGLTYRWVVKRETNDARTGGDREREPETLAGAILEASGGSAAVRVPGEPGIPPVRLRLRRAGRRGDLERAVLRREMTAGARHSATCTPSVYHHY